MQIKIEIEARNYSQIRVQPSRVAKCDGNGGYIRVKELG